MKARQSIMALAAAALLAAPSAGFGAIIAGDGADTTTFGPRNTDPADGDTGSGLAATGGFTMKVGGVSGGGRAAVYVFELPDLGAVPNPFSTASFSFGVGTIDANTATTTLVNGDLYGLGARDSSTVATTDYYLGSTSDSTDATLLQDNILVAGVTPANSLVETSTAGNTALTSYLNAQYASGAGVGRFVFLRLSPDKTFGANTGYNVYTANEPTNPNPTITYTAIPEPASLGLFGLAGLAFARRRRS